MDVNVEGGQAEAAPVIATAEAVSLSIPIPFLFLGFGRLAGPLLGGKMSHVLGPHALQVKVAEQQALNVHKKLNLQAAPIRQYLVRSPANELCVSFPNIQPCCSQEATVVPTVMQGLQAVCKERPENPVQFLAYYLLSHNPQGVTASPQAAAAAATPAEGAQ